MSEGVWLPAVVVLGAGLLFGVLLALRLRAGDAGRKPAPEPDLRLRIRDCEARRDELYLRLRAAEEEELSEDERAALEKAAARSLLELDRLTARLPAQAAEKREKRRQRAAATAAPAGVEQRPAPARARHPLLVGFAYGAGLVLVVTLLVYWAVRDARPRTPGATPAPMAETPQPPHQANLQLTPELAAKIEELGARLGADPDDQLARKELALSLLAAGDFFEAFNQAGQVLQRSPEDPDGLLVQGVVRLTMGQNQEALELLDRVLARHPQHPQALLYRGLALYQNGNRQQAVDTWELALEMVGGSNADLEQLLAMAASGEPDAASLPVDHPPLAAAGGAEASVQADVFRLRVELAPDAVAQPQATLFVFLRSGEGGPPVAARRVPAPSFPLELSLGAGDSMMGAELPASGILVARLDSDGAVATSSEADLEVQASGSRGELTRLVLRP